MRFPLSQKTHGFELALSSGGNANSSSASHPRASVLTVLSKQAQLQYDSFDPPKEWSIFHQGEIAVSSIQRLRIRGATFDGKPVGLSAVGAVGGSYF